MDRTGTCYIPMMSHRLISVSERWISKTRWLSLVFSSLSSRVLSSRVLAVWPPLAIVQPVDIATDEVGSRRACANELPCGCKRNLIYGRAARARCALDLGRQRRKPAAISFDVDARDLPKDATDIKVSRPARAEEHPGCTPLINCLPVPLQGPTFKSVVS